MAKYVKGVNEARLALNALKDIVHRPMLEAGRAALQPALDEARATVPRDKGHLASRLDVVKVRTGTRLHVRLLLGPVGRNRREHAHLAQVASLLEFGRAENRSGGGGFGPFAWLRRVFEHQKLQIISRYQAAYGPAVMRQIERLNKKG